MKRREGNFNIFYDRDLPIRAVRRKPFDKSLCCSFLIGFCGMLSFGIYLIWYAQ